MNRTTAHAHKHTQAVNCIIKSWAVDGFIRNLIICEHIRMQCHYIVMKSVITCSLEEIVNLHTHTCMLERRKQSRTRRNNYCRDISLSLSLSTLSLCFTHGTEINTQISQYIVPKSHIYHHMWIITWFLHMLFHTFQNIVDFHMWLYKVFSFPC